MGKSKNKKSYDIIFLERKLDQVVKSEEYEKAKTIKRWIDELMQKQK